MDLYKSVAKAMCSMLELWPSCKELFGPLSRHPRPPPSVPECGLPRVGHVPVWHGSGWRCTRCHRGGSRLLSHTSCIRLPPSLEEVLVVSQNPLYQHRLWMTCVRESGMPVIYCSACGAIAASKAIKLRDLICRPRVNSDLRKLRKGILPGGTEAELFRP